jgi:hypothetical protein
MDTIIENLNKYLKNSEQSMSAFGKKFILKGNYQNIEEDMNSGTFVKLDTAKLIKSYLSIIPQLFIFKNVMFKNSFIKKYKSICNKQFRLFNYDLIIHSIVLEILNKQNLLAGNICVIGDGKGNFVHGILDIKGVKKIYSVNLPQSLIQDYLILKKYNSIDCKLIKVVNNNEDLLDENCKVFLIPAKNKKLLSNQKINLFVNMFSFQEMPLSETHEYINVILSNSAYLYSLNREKKVMFDGDVINYYDYGIKEKGKIIFEKEAEFVKKSYNLQFPFIHKKKSKVISTLAAFT